MPASSDAKPLSCQPRSFLFCPPGTPRLRPLPRGAWRLRLQGTERMSLPCPGSEGSATRALRAIFLCFPKSVLRVSYTCSRHVCWHPPSPLLQKPVVRLVSRQAWATSAGRERHAPQHSQVRIPKPIPNPETPDLTPKPSCSADQDSSPGRI